MSKIAVRVDRITVSGVLKNYDLRAIHDQFGLALRDGAFYLERPDENGEFENVAFMAEDVRRPEHWRIDFNPAHLEQQEEHCIQEVTAAMVGAHFTRLDLAFDVFNDPLAMKHRVFRSNVTEKELVTIYRGRNKAVETVYWGTRKSEEQIRLYDKLVEQKAKKQPIPSGVEQWARLEVQLRGKRPAEWQASARRMLEQFKLEQVQKLAPAERMALHSLADGTVDWSELAKATKAKYRKLVASHQGFDTSLAEAMKQVLDENVGNLQRELRGYLAEFGVSEK